MGPRGRHGELRYDPDERMIYIGSNVYPGIEYEGSEVGQQPGDPHPQGRR